MDPQTETYIQHYKNQVGGQLHPFAGARRAQVGGSLGGVLSSALRYLAPLAVRGASTFLNETLTGKDSGKSWGEAARAAISPALGSVMDGIVKGSEQKGSGKRRRRHSRRMPALPPAQAGGRRRHAYKRRATGTHKKHSKRSKRIKFHNL